MLMLTRHISDEVVVFDKNHNEIVRIKVMDIDRQRIRLGFIASNEYTILRSEIIRKGEQCGNGSAEVVAPKANCAVPPQPS